MEWRLITPESWRPDVRRTSVAPRTAPFAPRTSTFELRTRCELVIDRVDRALARSSERCAYCGSGLYRVPASGCPCSRRTETRDRDEYARPCAPIEYQPGGAILSIR